ncbi:MAG: acetyl-CoA hydrolase/transferase C-terminal domain-containing protein [Thermodesulfobacteriota bacterium]
MDSNRPAYYQDVERCVDEVIEKVGKKIVLGLPLGLGKPNQLANAFYRRAKQDPSLHLTFCTALSLERPRGSSDLEQRFLGPFVERMFDGYVDLEYMIDLRRKNLPDNFELREFYAKAGAYLNVEDAQRNYISSNYTHAWRDTLDNGVNVIAQMLSKKDFDGRTYYSMGCNPEVALDLASAMREQEKQGKKIAIIGQVNQNMPFMYGDAVVGPQDYDAIIDTPEYYTRLFGAPKMSITTPDYMIGLHASTLIKDGGTLQIGIGSLGDALCYGLIMRHKQNEQYRRFLSDTGIVDKFGDVIDRIGGTGAFDEGISGSTEMLVDGYLQLISNGVVKRKTYNNAAIQRLLNEGKITEAVTPKTVEYLIEEGAINAQLTEADFNLLCEFGIFKEGLSYQEGFICNGEKRIDADLGNAQNMNLVADTCLGDRLKNGILIHGGFFLGPEQFYKDLLNMSDAERRQIYMTSVLNVNQLYANNRYFSEELKVQQRRYGRFVNACLMVTLTGAVVSDGLENGQVVSGVGGQYNFVAQAHALPDARSVLMCKGVRGEGKNAASNIVFNYGHTTVPRHLRDFVITEYGIADLRGKTDSEVIARLLNITDSRFQDGLLQQAKDAKKIAKDYVIPDAFRNNYPERLEDEIASFKENGLFPAFPFGTDFTDEELVIGKALKGLKAQMSEGLSKVSSMGRAITIRSVPAEAKPYLQRLQLDNPKSAREKMMQKLVVYALSMQGSI